MVKVDTLELEHITGGANVFTSVIVTAIVIFIVGIIEGITNPGRCRD